MKKTVVVTLIVLFVAALALAIIPTTRDEIHWLWVSMSNATSRYESYVKTWPEGRHTAEARARYDEHSWAEAQSVETVQAYERYLLHHGKGKHVAEAKDKIESLQWQEAITDNIVYGFMMYLKLHRDGKHVAEAKDKIESLQWQEATTANTVQGFKRYLKLHRDGKHVAEAEVKVSALPTDPAPYEAALREGTEVSLRQFLADFPGHAKEAEAQKVLKDITEGLDIVDLLKEKKIEVETQGSGIKSVLVRMRRLVTYSVTVRVPIGSYFVSARKSAQNMVSTAESKVRLTTRGWRSVSVSAACANRPRDIPGSKDSFRVQRSPHQAELARLMPVLDRARVAYAVRQAAVWIVTDNADYDDLGVLVGGPDWLGFSGIRQIKELEAARAMKICEEAGIDITSKGIWKDRKTVLQGLPDNELKKWLKARK